ncbi:MAG: hypothetical protein GY820_40325 [Gammaproteobacteria bacterium]|nr:hypothetical protein [Gammaproteobacteria bacterium]
MTAVQLQGPTFGKSSSYRLADYSGMWQESSGIDRDPGTGARPKSGLDIYPGPGEKGQFGRDLTGIVRKIFRSKW